MVKKIKSDNIKDELLKIGFDESYVDFAFLKHEFLNIKIDNLKPHQATIIKQTALSKGCDAAVHKGVLLNEVDLSTSILSGTKKQLLEVSKSLLNQPFQLKEVGKKISEVINQKNCMPKIMGILNITDNSLQNCTLDKKEAINLAQKMIENGADIIDIGAEATNPNSNPNSNPIDVDVEIMRLKDVIREVKSTGVIVSVDTRNSKTAEFAINEGADIINDVSGLQFDPLMADIIKDCNAKIIINHSKGTPQTMDSLAVYDDVADEVYNFLDEKIAELNSKGIEKERIIADVGFGFAKNTEQNFELLKRMSEFNSLNVPILAGVSRKRFLKSLDSDIDDITMLSSFYLAQNGVDIIRVHNVSKTKTALKLFNSIY